jgi:hypothetical protein
MPRLHYLIKRGGVALVGSEAEERNQFLRVALVVDGTQLHYTAEALDDVSILVLVFGRDTLEELNKAADDDGLDLLEESRVLQGLTRNVEGKIVGW